METFDLDSFTGASNLPFSSGANSFDHGNDSSDSGTHPSAGGGNLLQQSPFGRLSEVLGEEGLSTIFGGVGNSTGDNSSMNSGLPYGGNPFAGDNFWNIFAGGVNPASGNFGAGGSGNSAFSGGSPFG
jgi:hypothetical protein